MNANWNDLSFQEPDVFRILVADDDPATRDLMKDILTTVGNYEVDLANDGVVALEKIKQNSYNLVITDMKMPQMNGIELLKRIRAIYVDLPVMIATGFGDEIGAQALELGADDVIYLPFKLEEFRFRVARTLRYRHLLMAREALMKANQELWGRAITDRLTGLYNRQYFEEVMSAEFERARRYRTPLGCIMFDIDHFKQVNDVYGHLVGDIVLKEIGTLVTDTLRRADIAARYGGEEFVLILPETTREGVHLVAERLRHEVEKFNFCQNDPPQNPKMRTVTISLGAVHFPDESVSTRMEFLKLADEMLYAAKEAGRNKVVIAWKK